MANERTSDPAVKNSDNVSGIDSGCTNPQYFDQMSKRAVAEKSIKEINAANSPKGRGKAPGSVRI